MPSLPEPIAVVVDDEAGVRGVIAEYVARLGFKVLEAANGLEGLQHVQESAPRVVILDLRMPRLGGIEALKIIRKLDPRVVVIVVSAVVDADVEREALAQGARAVLHKPLDLNRLEAFMPAAEAAASPIPPPPAPSGRTSRPAGAPARVLVVDDDESVRAVLADFLGTRGYVVQQAPDGIGALRAVAADPPEVILLDVAMPGLSGPEALPTLRALAPGVNVILVSGGEDVDMRALALGVFDYILKPIDFQYLAQSLEEAVAMTRMGS